MFIDGIEEKYPGQLLSNKRVIVEGNIIGSLFSSPELYEDYKNLKAEDFVTIDAQYYFAVGREMYKLGYKSLDNVAINTYLSDKEILKNGFDNRGGYSSIKELIDIVNIDNFETYYDELTKYNILMKLHDKGFNVVKELDKFDKMNSEMVYNYFDYQLNNVFVEKHTDIKVEDLTKGYEDFIDDCDKGINMGADYHHFGRILNYTTSGIHEGITLLCANSGFGKTSMVVNIVLSLLENGEKVLIVANEQNVEEFRQVILATVMSTKNNYYKFNRKRFQQGKFTQEEREELNKAQNWLRKYDGNLKFVKMFDYDINNVKKILKKYAKLGYKTTIYDTFKNSNLADSDNPAWATLMEHSKELFKVADKERIKLICTMQLAGRILNVVRYLNQSCLSGATGVAEIANLIIMFRDLWDDEKSGGKKDVKCFNYIRDEDGRYTKSKEYFETKEDERYSLLFITKNRWGESDIQLLYRKNLAQNIWKELGYANVHQN